MPRTSPKSRPTWTDLKAQLADFDRKGLLGLIQDLYAANKHNRTFLHTRFGLGEDTLKAYKETIDRWLWPDVIRNQNTSVIKAKEAVSSYKKDVGDPAGLAELMAFYCEQAVGFCSDVGYADESYFNALVNMFENALATADTLPEAARALLIARLDRVRRASHEFGYGVGDDLDDILANSVGRHG